MTPRDTIGSHFDNDRPNLWRFERNTGLPRGYLDKGVNADAVVVVICAICLVVGLAASL